MPCLFQRTTKGPEMTTDNPDPLEEAVARTLSCHLWATIVVDNNDDCDEFDVMPEYVKGIYRKAAAAIIAQHYAPVIAENERLRETLEDIIEVTKYVPNTYARYANKLARQALGAKP